MKKILLSLFISILCIPLQMKAVTADDLDGKLVGQIFFGGYMDGGWPTNTCVGYFQKTGTNTVRLINFLNEMDVDFIVSSNVLTMSNTSSGVTYTNYSNVKKKICAQNGEMTYKTMYLINSGWQNINSALGSPLIMYYNLGSNLSGNIQTISSGYRVDMGSSFYIHNVSAGGTTLSGSNTRFYSKLVLHIYDGDVNQSYTQNGTAKNNKAKVLFDEIDGYNLHIYNFGGLGPTFYTDYSQGYHIDLSVDGNIDYNTNTITIPIQQVNSIMVSTYQALYVQAYTASGRSYNPYPSNGTNSFITSNSTISSQIRGCIYASPLSCSGDITGTYRSHVLQHVGANLWDSNSGGANATNHTEYILDFTGTTWITSVELSASTRDRVATNANTVIKPDATPYTHSVQLKNCEVKGNTSYLNVSGEIYNRVNSEYVVSYDLYLLPEGISSISGKSLNNDTGIAGAVWLKNIAANASSFNCDITNDPTLISNIMSKGSASLFLKANYSSVNSTFHGLTSVDAKIVATPSAAVYKMDNTPVTQTYSSTYGLEETDIMDYSQYKVMFFDAEAGATYKYAIKQDNIVSGANYVMPSTSELQTYTSGDVVTATGEATIIVCAERYGVLSEPFKLAVRQYPDLPTLSLSEGALIGPDASGNYTGYVVNNANLFVNANGIKPRDNGGIQYSINGSAFENLADESIMITDAGTITLRFVSYSGATKTYTVTITKQAPPEGIKYSPISMSKDIVVRRPKNENEETNTSGRGYIICAANSSNEIIALTKNDLSDDVVCSEPLELFGGCIYHNSESNITEFYISRDGDNYYFWTHVPDGESYRTLLLTTDPYDSALYLESRADAISNGNSYLCTINFTAPASVRRRTASIDPGTLTPANIIYPGNNEMSFNNTEGFQAYSVTDLPVYLFATEDHKTTGVENLINTEAQVIVDGRAVVIIGSDSPVSIANLAGIVVYNGNERHVELIPGIYIVTIDGRSTKIAIE